MLKDSACFEKMAKLLTNYSSLGKKSKSKPFTKFSACLIKIFSNLSTTVSINRWPIAELFKEGSVKHLEGFCKNSFFSDNSWPSITFFQFF